MTFDSIKLLRYIVPRLLRCVATAPGGDMLIYAQGMYIMHVPFNPSDENRGSQTLYIPGKRHSCLFLCLKIKS